MDKPRYTSHGSSSKEARCMNKCLFNSTTSVNTDTEEKLDEKEEPTN